jgi:hypothetical protein
VIQPNYIYHVIQAFFFKGKYFYAHTLPSPREGRDPRFYSGFTGNGILVFLVRTEALCSFVLWNPVAFDNIPVTFIERMQTFKCIFFR